MMRKSLWVCVVCLAGLALWACSKDKGNGSTTPVAYDRLSLEFFSAAPLPSGMIYQLWASPKASLSASSSNWVSLARFNLRASDTTMVDAGGAPIAGNLLTDLPVDFVDVDSIYITIEKATGDDAAPSGTVYLRAKVPDIGAGLRIAAFTFPVSQLVRAQDSISQFTFVSPTDNNPDNGLSGVWFMTPNFTEGLFTLQALPSGWDYEGWVTVTRGAVTYVLSTGRFDTPSGNDEGVSHSGPVAPPGFPGEDFLNPPGTEPFPLVFGPGDQIKITAEPDQDPDSTSPFPFVVYTSPTTLVPDTLQPFRFRPHPESIPVAQGVVSKSE